MTWADRPQPVSINVHTDPLFGAVIARGVLRYVKSLGRPDNAEPARTDHALLQHLNGCAAELAVARCLGTYWPGHVNTYRRWDDLPGGIEVKSSLRHESDLRLNKRVTPDTLRPWYVLAWGCIPTFAVVGCISGAELRDRWCELPRPDAYGVRWAPWDWLHPIAELTPEPPPLRSHP